MPRTYSNSAGGWVLGWMFGESEWDLMHFCPRFINRGYSSCWVFTAFIVVVMVTGQTLKMVVTKLYHRREKKAGVEQHRIRKLVVAVIKLAVQIILHLLQVIVKLHLLRKAHLQHLLLDHYPISQVKPNPTGHHHRRDHLHQLLLVVRTNYRHHLL